MKKKAIITGITGQDGSYLSDLLLKKNYEIHGIVRRTSSLERSRLKHIYQDKKIYNKSFFLHYSDMEDPTTFRRILNKVQPDELYHLAGQSHVAISFEIPESTSENNGLATLRLLEMLRDMINPPRLFHATSSEIFGNPSSQPQDENTPVNPTNIYGVAKAFATQCNKVYRQKYGLYLCNGILYNHESPRRGENFVTKKICRATASIKLGLQKQIQLGDISAQRDWGWAPDYVYGYWLTLQQEKPDDYVFSTGKLHSVKDIIISAFKAVNLPWENYITHDESFIRANEHTNLVGNSSKAYKKLNWKHTKSFDEIIKCITLSDLELLKKS